MLIFENLTQPFEQPVGDAADTSLRRVCIELFYGRGVYGLCVSQLALADDGYSVSTDLLEFQPNSDPRQFRHHVRYRI